jgi:hypothetical protein
VRSKDCEGGEWFRDNVEGANVQMVDNANDTSAHDMQDEGEGYDEVLNRLSAETRCKMWGEVELIISKLL